MPTRPYLRAFLAGIFVPVLVLPLILSAFIVFRLVLQISIPVERAIIFPMALVPMLWGLWNMLWHATHKRTQLPIELHGMLLPFLLLPLGSLVALGLGALALETHAAVVFEIWVIPYGFIAGAFVVALCAYYLLWKHIVGVVNRVLGVA